MKEVEDPRRFGVAQLNQEGRVVKLVEKPRDMSNNLVVVGFYYFRSADDLMAAIQEQMNRNVQLQNEYFLADAINILLEQGADFRTRKIETWLDAGTPNSLLATNQYLLSHGYDNSAEAAKRHAGVAIVPPVYVNANAHIENSVVGPYVSVGEDCDITNAIVHNSILENCVNVHQMILEDSLLGQEVQLNGQASRFNIGNASWIER